MPCDQINIVSVDLNAADEKILHDALEASEEIKISGNRFLYKDYYSFQIANGKVEADETVATEIANAVNRAYSNQVVKVAAKRYGWAVKTTGTGKVTLSKRK